MQANTLWKAVYDEGEHRYLWAISVDGAQYRCGIWSLGDDDLALLTSWTETSAALAGEVAEPAFLAHPAESETFSDLADAYAFFGTDHDQALRGEARAFLSQIDPIAYPDPYASSAPS